MANQVILASIWYITSCACISLKEFKQAKALVMNYVCCGEQDKHASVKVRWDTIIMPVMQGGLKLLDP